MTTRLAAWGLLGAFAAGALAQGEGAVDDNAQRSRIAAERAAAESAYERRVAACGEHFVVMPCVDAARKTLRDERARLRHEEVDLDAVQRRRRAAQRLQEIAARSASAPAEAAASAAPRPSVTVRAPQFGDHPVAAPPGGRRVPPERPSAAEARENVRRFESQRAAAAAHRAAVETRNAARAASATVAAPLPPPGLAGSAP